MDEDASYPLHNGPPTIKLASKQCPAGHYLQLSQPSQWTVGPLQPGNRVKTQQQKPQGQPTTISTGGRQLLDALSRMSFIDSAELAGILGEPHTTVHRALTRLLAKGIVGRVSHGTAHLPSSQRYYLTANGIREAAQVLDFDTPSDFVRAYPVSREWLALLIRRMDAVAAIYRLAASLSPGVDGLRSHVELPPGPLRCHDHPPRRPRLRRCPQGPGPSSALAL